MDQTALAELLGSDQKSARVTFVRIGEEGAIVENQVRARIFKLLRSPRINSKESIPPAYVAWRAGTATLFLLGS